MSKLRVLIADDKEFMREALAKLLADRDNMEVVGMGYNGQDALEKAS